jgi:SAM-dependent methyltransferase
MTCALTVAEVFTQTDAMNIPFLNQIREQELAVAGAHFSHPKGRLLEIGAGTGAQARVLSQCGFEVHAIEIAGSIYEADQVFPVAIYDGTTLPFADASFDIVFSSHVLVHIPAPDAFQQEILRVLKPGGQVVHILPTTSWRFWTCLVHYPARYAAHGLRALKKLAGHGGGSNAPASPTQTSELPPTSNAWSRLMKKIRLPFTPPARIGEHGNALTEHYLFSEHCWSSLFQRNGQVLTACVPNRLFYTGHLSFGGHLQMRLRSLLSYLLGSAGKVYVLRSQQSL